jgi:hypothetical protein
VLAAALVPHPPLLVPVLAAGAAPSVAPLLAACDAVITGLLACSPGTVVLVGSGRRTGERGRQDAGILAGFGTESAAGERFEPATGTAALPLSLTIGRWLLQRAGWSGDVVLQEVAAETPAAECEKLGRRLADATGTDSVWLALGDGSIRRGARSPGHDDPRAAGFDAEVARAFATADLSALLGLDVDLAAELGAAGRPVWQLLAGATAADPAWTAIDATVHYDDAPFGVEYLVADWRPRSAALRTGEARTW